VLILQEYIVYGDEEIDELKEVVRAFITDEELVGYGYDASDLIEEIDRLKKWSVDDRKKLVDYIKLENVLKIEELIIQYENAMKEIKFSDIDNHWAQKDIEFLAKMGIIQGKSVNKFDPQGKITRAEFTALVVRLFNLKSQSEVNLSFTDMKSEDWSYEAIKAAYEHGIIEGISSSTFSPNGNITREEMVAMIIRIIEKQELLSGLNATNKDINIYGDKSSVSSWALDYMEQALNYGIINGRTENTLVPKDNTTRAEAASIIMRLYNILNK